jgi:hypothetical protein
VEGRVFGVPRSHNPHADEELVRYVTASLSVDRILSGTLEDASARIVRLELPIPRADALAQLVGTPPTEPAVFLLFDSGKMAAAQRRSAQVQAVEKQYYALITFGAVVRKRRRYPRVSLMRGRN